MIYVLISLKDKEEKSYNHLMGGEGRGSPQDQF